MSRLGDAARALARLAPSALVRPFGRPVVLFFHGAETSLLDPRIQSHHHDRETLYVIAKSLKADFDVAPLSAVDDVLEAPERHRRTVFLTCDDGYANALSNVAEALSALSLPWTLFVCTHHVDTGERNPVFLARLFFYFAPDGMYVIPNFPLPIVLGQDRDATALRGLAALKALPRAEANDALSAMMRHVATDAEALIARFASERFLTWPEVQSLKRGGVEIGAHAHVHWAMHGGQSDAELREQANRPRALLESRIGPCQFFAYPFGNVPDLSNAAWKAVCDAGYTHAFTTLSGALGRGMNPYLLPRYEIAARETRLSSLIPLLRAGNLRLRLRQAALAA